MKRRKKQPDFPALGQTPPSVSIIIVTYNTQGRFLKENLESLRALDYPDFEVLIVDNASTDETRPTLQSLIQDEQLILLHTNEGFAGGCNVGIKHAKGKVLVMLNSDTVVSQNWLRELIKPMQQNPRVAITGCKMYFPDSRLIQHAGGFIHENGMCEHHGYKQEDTGQFNEERDVDYLTGAGIAIRREFLEACGGFDEAYYPAYLEDADLCQCAHEMGYLVIYTPHATLQHFESPTMQHSDPRFLRMYYRNRIIFCIKHLRLRDWLFGFLPYEINWLRAPYSKGLRKKQIRAYLDGLLYIFGRRYSASHPLPEFKEQK